MGLKSSLFIWGLVAASFFVAQTAAAKDNTPTPHQLVESVTTQVLADIRHYRDTHTNDRSKDGDKLHAFFNELDNSLGELVDFDWIAVNVMGSYRQLASKEQIARFQEVFRRSLVETYGRGLLNYSDQEIIVLPPDGDIEGKRKVSVTQQIKGTDANYPLVYSMGLNRSGEWKVLNVIINGINLGKTFRNQFQQAAEKHQGDLDSVIDNWSARETAN